MVDDYAILEGESWWKNILQSRKYGYNSNWELCMNKTYSMSIRVSEEELSKLKRAAKLEAYSSYSEFVRRTVLKEADRVVKK